VRHPEVARFLNKRVRVYQRSGEVFTGYLQMADARLLAQLKASGYLGSGRVYQVQSHASHPELAQTSYMIPDPATIERIELEG
jgi:small nuclear ribonucleoprotein (snRNP)-like protein